MIGNHCASEESALLVWETAGEGTVRSRKSREAHAIFKDKLIFWTLQG